MGLQPAWGSPGVAGDALDPSSTLHGADVADALLRLSAQPPSPCVGITSTTIIILLIKCVGLHIDII